MAAEEAACNGGGEARKAESAVKEAAAASPEPKVVEKREGEVLSDPLVVANGNSGGHSVEEDATGSNASPAVAVAGSHEADTARNASLLNGHVHAVAEAPVCVESSGERAAAELVEQEVDGGEPDGVGVAMANGHDHVDTSIAVKLVEQVAGEEQDARDGLLTDGNAAPCAAAAVFDAQGNESKGEGTAKLVEQETATGQKGNEDVSMVHGHDQVDRSVDSCTVDVEGEVCGDKDKGRESADATYLVGQATTSGELGSANESMVGGCDHPNTNADSGGATTQTEVCPKEREVAQSAGGGVEIVENERALKIEGQGSEGDAKVANSEVPREEEVHTNGHGHAEESADVVAELEPLVEEGQGEATLVIDPLEDRADNDREEIVQDTGASAADETAEEVESQVEQRKDKSAYDVTELTEGFAERNEEALLGGELAKHEADVSNLKPAEPLSYSTVEVEKEEAIEPARLEEASLAFIQEQTADSFQDTEGQKQSETPGNHIAVKNDNDKLDTELKQETDMDVVVGLQLQADPAAVAYAFHIEPRSLDLAGSGAVGVEHSTPACEVEHSTPACEVETPDNAPREDNGSQENFSSAIAHVELGAFKEHETVGVDDAEPGSWTRNESGVVAKAEASSNKDNKPNGIVDETEPSSQFRNESGVVAKTEASSNKEDKPNGTGEDGESAGHTRDPHSENMVDDSSPDDQLDLCNISTPCAVVSSGTGNMDSFPINEPASSAEKPLEDAPSPDDDICTLDGACNEISSENADTFTKSSFQVETKYVKDLESPPVDMIVHDDEKLHGDNSKIFNNSSESQLQIDTENKGDVQVITPQRIYITKVPRFAGEDLWAKIQVAQAHLDQLTQKRDTINVQRQKQKALCDEYREKLEAARQEERGARAAHGDKRHDLNSVQSMIGKLNKANSIQEIDEMIATKDKIIVHESISLKEEKLLLQEIKELKAQRKQLCSNMGPKAEMNEAFHQKEHIHEQHKTLKKDSGELLTNLKSLEEKTKVVQKAYDDERAALRKLNEEHRAANEIRQKAYDEWFELKMEPSKKNKYFFMYRNNQKTASEDYLSMGDMVGLQLYCNNQVERFMEMWNKDEDFRTQYIESNKISTLRRLGTSDGRRIGPDEVPPEIPGRSNRKPSNLSLLPVSSPHVSISASEAAPAKSTSVITPVEEGSFPVLQGPQNSKRSKSKIPGNSSGKETAGAPVPEREDVEHIEKEKMRRMEEDLELARQAAELAVREEELRQEKAAAEKERLRLEQKAKAKEAEERKKRKAEKAQERADYRARKEAEMKKAKQDKKKGTTYVDSANGSDEGNAEAIATNYTSASTTANTQEVGVPQHAAPKKRLSRPSIALKQLNRVEPMPLPLRNRGKRKMRQYILVTVAILMSVLALFMAGYYVSSSFGAWPF